jgi:hydrogenase expression/formation protein HypC
MCLATPGKVIQWLERQSPFARAVVDFGGVRREVSMDFAPEAAEGDYVIVHAGVAISRLDPEEAVKVLETLEQLELAAHQAEQDGGAP